MSVVSISVVTPCLNEEKAVGNCVKKAAHTISEFKVQSAKLKAKSEIIVVDNGSTDQSAREARRALRLASARSGQLAGARVVREEKKGYGFALRRGISEAKGGIIIIGDCDGSYDFSEIPRFLEKINEGYDLVVGSRFKGEIAEGAMPFWHRYLGTPVLNFLFQRFFGVRLSDTQSGFRAFKKDILKKITFRTGGMEFASEMIFKTARAGFAIGEVPVSYAPRVGFSKLSPIRDGWRHFKFLLLFSPAYLFVFPGVFLFLASLLLLLRLSLGPIHLWGREIDVHSMLVFSFLTILGFQMIFLGLFAKTYSFLFLKEEDSLYQKLLSWFTLEKGILIGGIFAFIGFFIFGSIFYTWARGGFGALSQERLLILSVTILILGIQGIFSSFFFALLGSGEMGEKER